MYLAFDPTYRDTKYFFHTDIININIDIDKKNIEIIHRYIEHFWIL